MTDDVTAFFSLRRVISWLRMAFEGQRIIEKMSRAMYYGQMNMRGTTPTIYTVPNDCAIVVHASARAGG
ncbi:MAG: hypothetical protein PW788_12895 [Micavibrio sp.]|nr:hypothetical protein [Micavibrio sp.]